MNTRVLDSSRIRLAGVMLLCAGAVTAGVLAVTSVAGDSGPPEDAGRGEAEPAPVSQPDSRPRPQPDPAPRPEPVDGAVELVGVEDLSPSGTGLFQPGSDRDVAVAIDERAVEAFVSAIADDLDSLLAAANLGEDLSTSHRLIATGDSSGGRWIDEIGSPGSPVTEAHYAVTVAALGVPQWAEALVTTERADGRAGGVTLVFSPSDDGPVLMAVEPGSQESADRSGEAA